MIEEFDYPFLPIEVVIEIFGYVSPSTYKTLLHVCDRVHKELFPLKYRYCNQLWTLILKFPNWDWDWDEIAKNPNTTMKILEDYMENPSKYPKRVPYEGIFACDISSNPNLTLDFIEMYPDEFWEGHNTWDWVCISANPNMSLGIMDANPTLPWKIDGKLRNKNVDIKFIEQHIEHTNTGATIWWPTYYENPNITIEFLDKCVDEEHLDNSRWGIITLNNNITVQHIADRMHDKRYTWIWGSVLEKKNMTLDFIEEYLLKDGGDSFLYRKLRWGGVQWLEIILDVCSCECVTLEFVRKYFADDRYYTICNPKVDLRSLEKYFDSEQSILTGDVTYISKNPNLTVDFIERYAHLKWSALTLSSNTFGL